MSITARIDGRFRDIDITHGDYSALLREVGARVPDADGWPLGQLLFQNADVSSAAALRAIEVASAAGLSRRAGELLIILRADLERELTGEDEVVGNVDTWHGDEDASAFTPRPNLRGHDESVSAAEVDSPYIDPGAAGSPPRVETVLDLLESFNRKERFYVLAGALDSIPPRAGPVFRAALERAFGLPVPADALILTDYHLDWLHAALLLASGMADDRQPWPNAPAVATGTQEDVDLLVAFAAGGTTHLLLLEAKADAPFTNAQLASKADHLSRVFDADGRRFPLVEPRFGLLSPRSPVGVRSHQWPTAAWMAPGGNVSWLPLRVPGVRRRVLRCDEAGRPSAGGKHFRVLEERWPRGKE